MTKISSQFRTNWMQWYVWIVWSIRNAVHRLVQMQITNHWMKSHDFASMNFTTEACINHQRKMIRKKNVEKHFCSEETPYQRQSENGIHSKNHSKQSSSFRRMESSVTFKAIQSIEKRCEVWLNMFVCLSFFFLKFGWGLLYIVNFFEYFALENKLEKKVFGSSFSNKTRVILIVITIIIQRRPWATNYRYFYKLGMRHRLICIYDRWSAPGFVNSNWNWVTVCLNYKIHPMERLKKEKKIL